MEDNNQESYDTIQMEDYGEIIGQFIDNVDPNHVVFSKTFEAIVDESMNLVETPDINDDSESIADSSIQLTKKI